jgi:nucleoside-diphosphate-sugar epimerase
MRNNVLISGSSGFVGGNLIEYLNPYHNVSSISLRFNPDEPVHLYGDVYIHLAGKAHDLKNVFQPQDYYNSNYNLTKEAYNAFLRSGLKKFIFISSVKAVADHLDEPLTEDFEARPTTHYGKSKLLAEQYILNQVLPPGKSCFVLRPCMIHGPNNKGNLNLLHKLVSTGIPFPLAAFSNQRSFLSVENLCFIIKEILERDDIPSGVYNVADDEPLSTNEVLKLLSQAQNKRLRLWHVPKPMIFSLARVGDVIKLPLNTERLQKLTENFIVSNEKIKSVLKKDLPLSSRDGILKTARSLSSNE